MSYIAFSKSAASLMPSTFLLQTRLAYGPGCGSMPSSVRSRSHVRARAYWVARLSLPRRRFGFVAGLIGRVRGGFVFVWSCIKYCGFDFLIFTFILLIKFAYFSIACIAPLLSLAALPALTFAACMWMPVSGGGWVLPCSRWPALGGREVERGLSRSPRRSRRSSLRSP